MKKILGNWNNEHKARFNANLGLIAVCAMGFLLDMVVGGDWLYLWLVMFMCAYQAAHAYYFAKHPKKWKEFMEEIKEYEAKH